MRKTPVSAAVAMALGTTFAQAASIQVTELTFYDKGGVSQPGGGGHNTTVTGTISGPPAAGSFTDGGTLFFGDPWVASAVFYGDTHSSTLTWATSNPGGGTVMIPSAGTFPTFNSATYEFHLSGYQVAFGLLFSWSGNNNIPVLAVFDCGPGTAGSACTPVDVGDGATPSTGDGTPGTAMQAGPFAGQSAVFNGTLLDTVAFSGTSAVPIPAAAWLFGSGLLGLAGVARRRTKA